nr:meiotically up-regulated gene 65 protein [Quercus suber]
MSRQASFLNTIRESPVDALGGSQISLIDHTQTVDRQDGNSDAERTNSEAASASTPGIERTPSQVPLYKKLTSNSLNLPDTVRQQIAKQKYAKYDRDRYDLDDHSEAGSAHAPLEGDVASSAQASYLERSRAKAKGFIKRKRGLGKGKHEQDSALDILYENQRGTFFFGIPRYSSNSLLPSDPKPWQNAQLRTSPVDIRNAQVPDPNWEWVWPSWYVDMSRDVDEEGWEYSFMFKAGFNWHGNHPWMHSFVRRRRWIRMRKRKDTSLHLTKNKAHELTPEYFTIHPKTIRTGDDRESKIRGNDLTRLRLKREEEQDIANVEITDIASLLRVLKRSAVDREKLVAVRKFVTGSGEELYYLSQRMPEIMALFIYQSSRRQLLSELASHHDEAQNELDDLRKHAHADHEDAQNQHDIAVRHAENLLHAVEAADEQVQTLEYWSDVKDMAQHDELPRSDEWRQRINGGKDVNGHPQEAFATKQKASGKMPELHSHPEHSITENDSTTVPSKRSSVWFDSQSQTNTKSPTTEDSSDTELDRYITAAESASEISSPESKGRTKGQRGRDRMISLDGVLEREAVQDKDEHENENHDDAAATRSHNATADRAPELTRTSSALKSTGLEAVPPDAIVGDD